MKHWHRFPREAVEPPSLNIFKLAWIPLPEQPAVADPALSRSGAGLSPEVAVSLSLTVVLYICDARVLVYVHTFTKELQPYRKSQ